MKDLTWIPIALAMFSTTTFAKNRSYVFANKPTELCTRFMSDGTAHYSCGEMSWTGFPRGAKIQIETREAEWASIKCDKERDRCWFKLEATVDANKVEKAAIVQDTDGLTAGSLVFIIQKTGKRCRINDSHVEKELPCDALSTKKEDWKDATLLERAKMLKEFYEFEPALKICETATKNPKIKFKPQFESLLPTLKSELQKQNKLKEDPEYQDCFLGYNFVEGEPE